MWTQWVNFFGATKKINKLNAIETLVHTESTSMRQYVHSSGQISALQPLIEVTRGQTIHSLFSHSERCSFMIVWATVENKVRTRC